MVLKRVVVCAACLASLALIPDRAVAEGNLTIIATPAQVESMSALLGNLKGEDVHVTIVDPAQAEQAKKDEFIVMVITAQPKDPLYSGIGGVLLSDTDRARIEAPGGKKLIVLRDPWKKGQEMVVFAGHTEADANAVRAETRDRWWNIMGGWFDIFTEGMKGY